MVKKEMFDEIVRVSAFVCSVEAEDVISGSKQEDVVTARYIAIFWAEAAGFSVASLIRCMEKNNANSINSIREKQEEYWKTKFAYHMLVREAGERLLKIAHELGEDFDMWEVLEHMGKITGKYRYINGKIVNCN